MIGCGMGGLSFEFYDEVDQGLRALRVGCNFCGGMPVQANIEIVEKTIAGHIYFSSNGFFGRRSIKTQCAF